MSADPILERCLDIIEDIMDEEFSSGTCIRKAVRDLGPGKKEWHAKRHIKGNGRFFSALRTAAVIRGVRARASILCHDTDYIALCRSLDRALKLLKRDGLDIGGRLAVARESARKITELAGVLFVLPRLIPTSDLGPLQRKYKRERAGTAGAEQRRQEIVADLLWNEPVPILVDKLNEDAIQWHLAPENPGDAARRHVSHGFLWGRRMVVSMPIEEALGGRIGGEAIWAMVQDLARRADRERKEASRRWRDEKAKAIEGERRRLAALAKGGGHLSACAEMLMDVCDELLKHVDGYYSTRPGKARGKRDRGGVCSMLGRIGIIEEAFGERNRSIRESVRIPGADGDHTSLVGDVPDRRATDASEGEVLAEVTQWLMENLPRHGLDRKKANQVVKHMLEDRLRDGRMAGGRTPGQPKGKLLSST